MKSSPYLPRLIEPVLEDRMTSFPVVILTGARQTGKTTLVEHLPSSKDRKFRSLDDPVSLELAVKDPKLLLAEAEGRIGPGRPTLKRDHRR
jgi:predicted AAA+ superfamily ATPase